MNSGNHKTRTPPDPAQLKSPFCRFRWLLVISRTTGSFA